MTVKLVTQTQASTLELVGRRPTLALLIDGRAYQISETTADDGSVTVTVDGHAYRVWRALEGDRVQVKLGARLYSVEVEDPVATAAALGEAGNELKAEMPGVVVALRCAPNDTVNAGDPLLTLESMKMQLTVLAPRAGVVESIHVALNESFQKGARLVTLASESAAP